MSIIDHGTHDPLPFELGSWAPVADKVRESLPNAAAAHQEIKATVLAPIVARKLLEAASAVCRDAEEFEGPDGLMFGVPMDLFHELSEAVDRATGDAP